MFCPPPPQSKYSVWKKAKGAAVHSCIKKEKENADNSQARKRKRIKSCRHVERGGQKSVAKLTKHTLLLKVLSVIVAAIAKQITLSLRCVSIEKKEKEAEILLQNQESK